jgi:hypothetical protein
LYVDKPKRKAYIEIEGGWQVIKSIKSGSSTIYNLAYAQKQLEKLRQGEEDGWIYQLEEVGEIQCLESKGAKIKIYDQDHEFVGYL